jgi:hypothetical protein
VVTPLRCGKGFEKNSESGGERFCKNPLRVSLPFEKCQLAAMCPQRIVGIVLVAEITELVHKLLDPL